MALSSVDLPAPFGPMMPDELALGQLEVAAVEDVDLGHVAGDDVVGLEQRPVVVASSTGSSSTGGTSTGSSIVIVLLGVLDDGLVLRQLARLLGRGERRVVVGAEVGVDDVRVGC